MSPYVGMAKKTKWRLHACISVQTPIFHLVANFVRLKTLRSALWRCPILTIVIRLLKIVAKVTNLETVKIEFRHLRLLLSSSSFFSAPSVLTQVMCRSKHPRIVMKFFWHVPFELSL